MLWRTLRARGLDGDKFRRQVPLGPYVADFICFEARLIVELDGAPHDDPAQQAHDARRTAWLATQGFRVLRFPNDLLLGGSGDLVLDAIRRALNPHPTSADAEPTFSRKGRRAAHPAGAQSRGR